MTPEEKLQSETPSSARSESPVTQEVKQEILSDATHKAVRAEIEQVRVSFVENIERVRASIVAVLAYRDWLRTIIETGNVNVEGVESEWPERRKVRRILTKWDGIQNDLDDSIALFSQSRTPLRFIYEAYDGLKSSSGEIVVTRDQIEHFGFRTGHQLGNSLKGLFGLGARIGIMKQHAGTNYTIEMIREVEQIISAAESFMKTQDEELVELSKPETFWGLLGL